MYSQRALAELPQEPAFPDASLHVRSGNHRRHHHYRKAAEAQGKKVHARGSGWSFSDCAVTTDFLIVTAQLNKELQTVAASRRPTMSLLKPVTPEEAKRVWVSIPNPSARRVAKALTQSGRRVHHSTIARRRARDWRPVAHSLHPLEAARQALDMLPACSPAIRGALKSP
jgi:hypothetical protein